MSRYEHGGLCTDNIKLDFSINVNPLGIAPSIHAAMEEALLEAGKYPDPSSRSLRQMIADREGLMADNILIGNGASELIMALTHCYRPHQVLVSAPGFYGYEHAARAAGAEVAYHYLSEDRGFALAEAFTRDITDETDMIFITNPGNPSGRLIDEAVIDAIYDRAAEVGARLIIDECFLGFTEGRSYEREGVYRLRAFTKYYSLPGIRLGYLLCPDGEAARIAEQLPEWNVSVIAQRAGEAALRESDYYSPTCECIRREREYLSRALSGLGTLVYKSDANFVLFKTDDVNLKEKLIKYGILIRDCSNYTGLAKGYYRIAVKSHKDNAELIEQMKRIYEL